MAARVLLAAAVAAAAAGPAARRSASPLLEDCVNDELMKYTQCDVLKELETAEEITAQQVDILCFDCLVTVTHALSLDTAGVCDEVLLWASRLADECAAVDVVQQKCPAIEEEGSGCAALADLDVQNWNDLAPEVPIPLADLINPCRECLEMLDADLSRCPKERYFASKASLVCQKVLVNDCIASTFPLAFPGNPCKPTTDAMSQYQADVDLISAAATCDVCLPFFQDMLPSYTPQQCPDAPTEWTVNMRLACTSSSAADQGVCAVEYLRRIPVCTKLASVALGFKIEVDQDTCRACLDEATANAFSALDACPSLNTKLAELDAQCERGGFVALKCSDLFTWTQGNHTYATPEPPAVTGTELLDAGNVTDANGTNATSPPTPAPTPSPRVPGPCELPFSCECAEHFDAGFQEEWAFYLPLCGLAVETRKQDCLCADIAQQMYAAVPPCANLLELPDLFGLCSKCFPRKEELLPFIKLYDECTGQAVAIQVFNGLDSMCRPGGLGDGNCPNALTTGLVTEHCEDAFSDIIGIAMTGAPIAGVTQGQLCRNQTDCTTSLMNKDPLAVDQLRGCGVDVYEAHQSCQCVKQLNDFLKAAPGCEVLVGEQWRLSVQNFTRMCVSCLNDAQVRRSGLASYGTCIGKGYWYSHDLIASMDATCAAADATSDRPIGVEPVPTVVYESACVVPAAKGQCRAATLCDLEKQIPGCQLLSQHPRWMVEREQQHAVCDACIIPAMKAYQKGRAEGEGGLSPAEQGIYEAVAAAAACDAPLWDTTLFPTMCLHRPLADACDLGLPCPPAATLPPSCDAFTFEHLGLRWSRCLYRSVGAAQCACSAALLEDLPPGCHAHAGVTDLLCLVRLQGCPMVPYPDITGAECAARKHLVRWNALPLHSYSLCSLDDLESIYADVLQCAEGGSDEVCSCMNATVQRIPEACEWDAAAGMVEKVLCLFASECTAPGAGYPAAGRCNAHVEANRARAAALTLVERSHGASECTPSLAQLAARVTNRWNHCVINGGEDECGCLRAAHYDMALLGPCADGAVEWEVMRCAAVARCAPDMGDLPAWVSVPDHAQTCQKLLNPTTDEHVKSDYVLLDSVFADTPECSWDGLAEQLKAFDRCLMERPQTRVGKCDCLNAWSWAIPAACKAFPSAPWTHLRCMASDVACPSVPHLQASACDKFHTALLLHKDAGFSDTAPTAAALAVAITNSSAPAALHRYLAGSLPYKCRSSRTVVEHLHSCFRSAVSGGGYASNGAARNTALQSAVCRCVMETELMFAPCDRWQAGARSDVACLAAEWRCYGIETRAERCPQAINGPFSLPVHDVCAAAEASVARYTATSQTSCDAEAAFRTSIPFVCRAFGPLAMEYQTSLCVSLSLGCPVAEVPKIFCGRLGTWSVPASGDVAAAPSAQFHGRRTCRALSARLLAECQPLFNPQADLADVKEACAKVSCGAAAARYKTYLTAACLPEELVYVNWITSACTMDSWSGSLAAPAQLLFQKLRQVLTSPRHDAVTTHRPSGIGGVAVATEFRSILLGPCEGLPAAVRYEWRPPTADEASAFCTREFLSVQEAVARIPGAAAGVRYCTQQREGERVISCVANEAAWEWGSYTGGAAQCEDRCFRKSLHASVASYAPSHRQATVELAHAMCQREPLSGEYCVERAPEYLSGAAGATGASFTTRRTKYPIEECAPARQAFDQCRRSGKVPLCDCMAILADALPSRRCLQHVDVAPTTLCLLTRSDLCRSKGYYHDVKEYCSEAMYEELQCLEMLWNPTLACSQVCRQVMERYKGSWRCCAASIDSVFGALNGGEVLEMMERCAVTPPAACSPTVADEAFFARFVFDVVPEAYQEHAAELTAALRRDVIALLAVKAENVVGEVTGDAKNALALRHRGAQGLNTMGEDAAFSEAALTGAERYTTVGFFIAGGSAEETAQIQRDFVHQTRRGVVPVPTFHAAAGRRLQSPPRLLLPYTGTATDIAPLAELRETVGGASTKARPVAISFDEAAAVHAPTWAVAILACLAAAAF